MSLQLLQIELIIALSRKISQTPRVTGKFSMLPPHFYPHLMQFGSPRKAEPALDRRFILLCHSRQLLLLQEPLQMAVGAE